MKLKIRFAAIASALALVGGLTLAVVSPASAVTGSFLCTDRTPDWCAYIALTPSGVPTGPGEQVLAAEGAQGGPPPDWSYPVTTEGEIFYSWDISGDSGELCLTADSGSGHDVQMEDCSASSWDHWTPVGVSGDPGAVEFQNAGNNLCLHVDVYTDELNTYGCGNSYELWINPNA